MSVPRSAHPDLPLGGKLFGPGEHAGGPAARGTRAVQCPKWVTAARMSALNMSNAIAARAMVATLRRRAWRAWLASGWSAWMNRIWLAGIGLLVWQLCSMGFGFTEFMFGRPAPIAAVLASLATALAWVVLAAWAGYRRRIRFGIAAAILWIAIVAVLLLVMLTKALEGDYGVAPWHGALLLLLIVAGGPLYGLGSLMPIEDSLLGTTTVAVLILALMAAAYLVGQGLGPRGSTNGQDDADITAEER